MTRSFDSLQELLNIFDFHLQLLEARFVCRRKRSHHKIHGSRIRQESRSHQLAESPPELVTLDNRMPVLSHNDSSPCMRKQGVGGPNFQMFGTQSSPCFLHLFKI